MYVCIDPSVENGNCSTGDIRLVNYRAGGQDLFDFARGGGGGGGGKV